MFADTSFAAAPFTAQSASGRVISSEVSESASVSELTAAIQGFVTFILETTTGADSVLVAASVFNSSVDEAASNSEIVSVLVDFAVTIIESSAVSESVLVEPSTFGAIVSETAFGLDSSFPIGTYFVTINESVVAVDQIPARLLWEIINNSQSTTWQVVKTQG